MKSEEELKALHGRAYVENFESQSPFRLERLYKYFVLHRGDKVVDFACGNGMLMTLVAPHVESYAGVDFSEPFIEAANKRKRRFSISNAEFFAEDIKEFCRARPLQFDVAFAMDFSEHVYDAEWLSILGAIRGSLRPGGRLYLHTPNAEFFLEKLKARNWIVKQFPEHIAVRSPSENVRLLEEAGFSVSRVCLLAHYNILRFVHWLSYMPVVGRYLKARILIEAES